MSIFLAFINIILMVILFLLLAVFILVLVVLFAPVKYRMNIRYIDKELTYDVKMSYLFHLISANLKQMGTENEKMFRVAWKRYPGKKSDEPEEEKPVQESEKAKEREPPGEKMRTKKKQKGAKKKKTNKISIVDRIKKFYNSIKNIIQNYKSLNLDIRALIRDLILALKQLLRALKPKVLNMNLEFGLESPDLTGMGVGALAILKSSVEGSNRRYKIILEGNFEEKVLNLTAQVKGSFMLWFALWPFIKFYFSKSMKPVRKAIMSKLTKSKNKEEN